MFKSAGFSPIVAGFIAVVVGYAGPTVLAFEVARQIGMPELQVVSWFWAYSIASGVAGLFASWFWRVPVVLAWSTPGFGILAATLSGHSMNEAVGAYIVVAVVTILLGFTGWFERLLKLVPPAIAAAVLAGVLFPFVVKVMGAMSLAPLLVGAMIAAFVVMRLLSPQWMIATVALVAVVGSFLVGGLDLSRISFQFAVPQLIAPEFNVSAILDIAVPLLLVTLTGQYVPGFAILKSNGFSPPADALVRLCGFASLLSAPFGNHTVNPAAIIAGIAAGPDSHPDPTKRWPAGISAGITYLVFGSFAGSFVALDRKSVV